MGFAHVPVLVVHKLTVLLSIFKTLSHTFKCTHGFIKCVLLSRDLEMKVSFIRIHVNDYRTKTVYLQHLSHLMPCYRNEQRKCPNLGCNVWKFSQLFVLLYFSLFGSRGQIFSSFLAQGSNFCMRHQS